MTKDEIIKLAREAGGISYTHRSDTNEHSFAFGPQGIEAFALACYEAGRTAEKQECNRVCELEITRLSAIGEHRAALAVGICAAKIDARGKP